MRRGNIRGQIALALAAMACACPAGASNGLTLIGTGAESVAMGGADVAVARDTTALSTNPAGISQLRGWAHDGFMGAAFALDVAHADQFGNDQNVANWVVPIGGAGISKRIDNHEVTLGIGMFAEAGAGNVYNNLTTPFGGKDTLRAQFAVVKVTPGLAWRLSDALAVGAALNVNYSSLKQRIFPNTSVVDAAKPSQSFFGTSIDKASSIRIGGKFGALFKPSADLSLGFTYAPEVKIPFDNGRLRANLSALGLGMVTYHEVRLAGLALPKEIASGIAWQVNPEILVAFDLMWSEYSHALKSQSLRASNPDNPAAPSTIFNTAPLNWHDQTVFAGGVAYAVDDETRLYGGINYGRNPIPAETLNPLLATIGEWHLTGGFARHIDDLWQLSAALEYLLPKKVTYDNPNLPFGPGAQERNSYLAVTIMLSRRW